MTVREELDLFIERADEFIDSKYILADVKIVGVLKAIASSDTILALFKNCLADYDYVSAKKKYLVKNRYLGGDKGEFITPPNSRELLAFIFNILMEIDSKSLELGEFINKYFYVDGSYSSGYDAFLNAMIKPFKNSVRLLMESVIEGSLQDPIEALIEEENRKAKQKEQDEINAKKEKELLEKAYGAGIKAVKDMLLKDKQNLKGSKIKETKKKEINLIIDMLANVIDSEDKDAIEYAFVAYKYVAIAHPILFKGRVRKLNKILKDVVNEL